MDGTSTVNAVDAVKPITTCICFRLDSKDVRPSVCLAAQSIRRIESELTDESGHFNLSFNESCIWNGTQDWKVEGGVGAATPVTRYYGPGTGAEEKKHDRASWWKSICGDRGGGLRID